MAEPVAETVEERVKRLCPGKRYLGDGVYVQSAGWGTTVDLTAEDGVDVLHRIQLEPEVWSALQGYMTDLEAGLHALVKELNAAAAAEEETT